MYGSVCSGIEAAHFAFEHNNYKQIWSSEIAEFPSKLLSQHYPNVPNLGDMTLISDLILKKEIDAPDVFCGGTPCQAFSLAGWKNGLNDERGVLTMKFIDIADSIDFIRAEEGKEPAIVLWENVEGVLNDKTNAFGNFLAGLAGFTEPLVVNKWSKSGVILGKTRNIAWRVLDAKYFGLPQQRKRLYVLAGGKNFRPDQILFEIGKKPHSSKQTISKRKVNNLDLFRIDDERIKNLVFHKNSSKIEFFREYTDCLYSAYGTKWNGNAAAYNGSLFISQNDRVRRLTPLECERLMGFPDNYILVQGSSDTNRYQAIGNSWAVPVVKWIGENIFRYLNNNKRNQTSWDNIIKPQTHNNSIYLLGDVYQIDINKYLNTSNSPNEPIEGSLFDIVQIDNIPEKLYLTPKACLGILRRKTERNIRMNSRLEELLKDISKNLLVKIA